MSCASYLGSGHRLEFYGEEGMLVLANSTADYIRGFRIAHARRPATAPMEIEVDDDPLDQKFPNESRIAPVSRLAKKFLDAIEQRRIASPNFADGYRVQVLLDAVRRSYDTRRWIVIEPKERT
jgi:predicted dehydrogenase